MSLRLRLLLLLLGLPLSVGLIYGAYDIYMERQQVRQALVTRIADVTATLAPAVSLALEEGRDDHLRRLAQRLLDIDEVAAVSVRDADGDAVLSLGETQPAPALPMPDRSALQEAETRWRWLQPLGSPAEIRGNAGTAYWLDVDLGTTALTLTFYRQLASHGMAGLVLGLVLFLIAYPLSRRLTAPLQRHITLLERLHGGDFSARLTPRGSRELVTLGHQLNALGEQMMRLREDTQAQIDQTTFDLRESMETIEVKNIELDMAHRRALEANRIKSQFLANISHEIRTPLNGIIGFCQLLGRSALDSRQREWLEQVQTASDNLLSLISDVLDFSKIEAGKLELETVPVDMVTLVDEVLGLQAPTAQRKSLHLLGLVYDDVPDQLLGDPLRIKQILTNLVNNAVKFTERGEVVVRVMLDDLNATSSKLRISVRDTGIGLDLPSRERLFQAFSQGDASRSRKYGGTGLGLMISKRLVEQMGGDIDVESESGEGTTFTFTLTLIATQQRERLPEVNLSGYRIGLFEAHPASRHALTHLLERWHARVVLLSSREACSSSTPDLDLLVLGLTQDDLRPREISAWRDVLDHCKCPGLLLVNADPFEIPDLALPHGGEITTKPVSRRSLGNALSALLLADDVPSALPAPNAGVSPRKVLVVDDTPSNRLLVKELLQDRGLTPLLAGSGEEALAMAQSEPVALVLMDIQMPGMNGVETMRALRDLGDEWQRCPIVALTAHALEEERQQLLRDGMSDCLIKPIREPALDAMLERHLADASGQDTAEAPAGIASDVVTGAATPAPTTSSESAPHEPATSVTEDETASEELPVVDMQLGIRMAGGRENLANDMLGLLFEHLDDSERAIHEAWIAQDAEAFHEHVHRLNGACRYCGVPQLALLAETLETRFKAQGLDGCRELYPALQAAIERLREWQARHWSTP
ncbi:ATP-binding protein [Chromohalobacter israelensis]|uniref:histidine kinase n=1 Tax=Chromohalobacter israelensis (strain ATCC BAA-138 / DSM 3043 / CIP 106854 / NCIMB 13768 / 1H11) TaxID=290398 RepID=Q1QX20_CHRI1|nr:ATP-binding protein [Chromohalobacter salexigens]ABE58988.1 multi-sensor hybrid histidine kinase [Chromohalobacter salexigens DSM 3043]